MLKKVRKLVTLTALSAVILPLAAQQAEAVPTLRLSDGATTVEIMDGTVGDIMGTVGIVGFTGAVGNFAINITTGLTKPVIGSDESPLMDIISFNSTSLGNGGGTLTLMFTETDFIPYVRGGISHVMTFLSSIGGTTNGAVSYETYLGETNGAFEMSTLLGNVGPLAGMPVVFGGDDLTLLLPENNYSLTMVVTVEHTFANQNTSFDAELKATPNPEPATVGLSAMALLSLIGGTRRRRSA